MKTILAIALSATLGLAQADQGDWTVHTVSAHLITEDMNNFNPGLAYDITDNYRVGGLYNSFEKPSLYVARIFDVHSRVRVGAGIISGYKWDSDQNDVVGKTASVLPFLAVEVDVTDNVSVIWFGEALNLEVKF